MRECRYWLGWMEQILNMPWWVSLVLFGCLREISETDGIPPDTHMVECKASYRKNPPKSRYNLCASARKEGFWTRFGRDIDRRPASGSKGVKDS